jgi:hypothetical protein
MNDTFVLVELSHAWYIYFLYSWCFILNVTKLSWYSFNFIIEFSHVCVTRASLLVRLNNREDRLRWGPHQNETFSVKSMYKALICDNRVWYNMILWKLKMALKIKIFMWYVKWGVVLARCNLVRCNWKGNKLCSFSTYPESIKYLFFDCHFDKFLWRAIAVTFNIAIPNSVGHLFNDYGQIVWDCIWESSV